MLQPTEHPARAGILLLNLDFSKTDRNVSHISTTYLFMPNKCSKTSLKIPHPLFQAVDELGKNLVAPGKLDVAFSTIEADVAVEVHV